MGSGGRIDNPPYGSRCRSRAGGRPWSADPRSVEAEALQTSTRELMMHEDVRKGATNEPEEGSIDWTATMDALVEINHAMHAVLSH